MSGTRRGTFSLSFLKYLAGIVSFCAALTVTLPAQTTQQPLSFFKNYFVTGDYVVRGVSLWRKGVNGTAVAEIPALGGPNGVPPNADIVAAFLYVQTAERIQGSGIEHAQFLGHDLGPFTAADSIEPGSGTFAKPLVAWENAPTPCWSVAVPGGRKLMTYRVDVLRFLQIDPDTRKQDLTAPHAITVPDAGKFFGDDDETCRETKPSPLPRALGASLLVVYRDPAKPFSAIVIYDGAYTKRALAKMVQPIAGFYQSSLDAPSAKMTHIVGDGRPRLLEQVLLGGQLVQKNPYVGASGTVWDNPTFTNLPLPAGAEATTVTVDRLGLLSDCVTFSAMVFRTTVQDSDGDGLIDRWETSPPPADPIGRALPDLGAMGASLDHKDLFVQIDYMYAAEGTRYGGNGQTEPEHSHLPGLDVLKMVADSFDARGIKVHFDVGQQEYQGLNLPFIVPQNQAQGGQAISETRACDVRRDPTDPATAPPYECATIVNGYVNEQADMPGQYPKYPGTVGWKTGFQLMRDDLFGFDPTRKDIFHYALFAHSVGIPKDACQKEDPPGSGIFVSEPESDCDARPDFHVPRTNSGIADFPGGDLLITLGAFRSEAMLPVGTPFMQGSTLMHELGHNFELTHAGLHESNDAPREPNCKPNYHSVMNYLYQLRGLPDGGGKLWMDYSGESLGGFNELLGLTDAPLGGTPRYRSGWYAPLSGSYLASVANVKAATKHCDGSDLLRDGDGNLKEPAMVRVDAPSVGDPIDWNADGVLNLKAFTQDINFDGNEETLKEGSNDWAGIRLSQVGGRRSTGGYYVDLEGRKAVGPMSLDIGRGDIGRGDIGRGDIGRGDIGRGDIGVALGRGDIGRGDIGRGDIGRGDIGRGDIGRGDIGRGDIGRGGGDFDVDFRDPNVGDRNAPFGDLDLETSLAVTGNLPSDTPNSPANELTASLTGDALPVTLSWQAPHLNQPYRYSIYRFIYDPAAVFPPAPLPYEKIGEVTGLEGPPSTFYLDDGAPSNQHLAYFVIAEFLDGESYVRSGISNFATVTTPVPILADLVVSLSHDPSNPAALDIIYARATVTNAGPGPAGPSWLEFCVGGETPGPSGNCRHTQVPGLAPGASFIDARQDVLGVAQNYQNHAVVDYLNNVPEVNEANNVGTEDYTVPTATGVTVSGIVYYSTMPVEGATVALHRDSTSTRPLRLAITGTDGSYSFALVPPATYYLRRWGPDGQGYQNWVASPVTIDTVNLTRDLDLPKVITQVSPENGTQAPGCLPELTWNSVPPVSGNPIITDYRIQLNHTVGWVLISPKTGTLTPGVTQSSYTLLSPFLTAGEGYTWSVDAYDQTNHWVGTTANRFTFIAGACAPVQ